MIPPTSASTARASAPASCGSGRWIFAALVGFVGGGIILIGLLFALAGLLR